MLEANPRLGWRDVQGILARTSQVVYEDDPTWVRNGAGLSHSEKYGYGIIEYVFQRFKCLACKIPTIALTIYYDTL